MYWNLLSPNYLRFSSKLIFGKVLVRWEGKRPPLALGFKFLRDTEIKFNKFST